LLCGYKYKFILRGFLYRFMYQPNIFTELKFCEKVIVIVCYRFYFYTPIHCSWVCSQSNTLVWQL